MGLACGTAVATAVMAGQWLLNVRLGFARFHGIGLVGPIVSFVVTTLLVGMLVYSGQQRRRARLARAQVVADCNHEIRNALQTLVALHYPQESLDQIRSAVQRIDWALRDLLPRIQDEESNAPLPHWDIQNGRLQVRSSKPGDSESGKRAGLA
jgi:hypothetical protein